MSQLPDRIRADKWLWHARFFKTRSLAARVISGGHFRVDGQKVLKPSHMIRPGVTLTFAQARQIRVVRVAALSLRRGPASEARALYHDLSPAPAAAPRAPGHDGPGRPGAKERRNRARFERTTLE